MRKASYDNAQERFIRDFSEEFTVKQLSESLGLTINVIHNIGNKFRLAFKVPTYKRAVKAGLPRTKPVKMVIVRPPAVYNQSGSPYGIASSMRHL